MDTSLDNKHVHTYTHSLSADVVRVFLVAAEGNVFRFNLEMWKMKFSINLRYFKDFTPSLSLSRYASGSHQYPYLCETPHLVSHVISRVRGRLGQKCVNKEQGWSNGKSILSLRVCQKQLPQVLDPY